jgi:methyl-accepting chemotaxis protein
MLITILLKYEQGVPDKIMTQNHSNHKHNFQRFINSLNTRFNVVVAFILIVVFGSVSFAVYHTVEKTLNRNMASIMSLDVSVLRGGIDGVITYQARMLEAYSQSATIAAFLQDPSALPPSGALRDMGLGAGATGTIFLVNAGGLILASGNDRYRGSLLPAFNQFLSVSSEKLQFSPVLQNLPGSEERTQVAVACHIGAGYALVSMTDIHQLKEMLMQGLDKDLTIIITDTSQRAIYTSGSFTNPEAFAAQARLNSGDIVSVYQNKEKSYIYSGLASAVFPWSVYVLVSEETALTTSRHILFVILVSSILSILFINVFFGYLVHRWLVRRIWKLEKNMNIASHGDLTIRGEERSHDEITQINHSFSRLMGGLGALIIDMNQKMKALTESSEELSGCIKNTIEAVNNIDESIHYAQNEVTKQSSSIGETNASVHQISSSIEKLNATITAHTQRIEESSRLMQRMLNGISQTDTLLNEARNSMMALKSESQEGELQLKKAIEQINNIAKSSKMLIKANTLVAKVASKTTLLSINAAIEAAHAGEHGSGFAVVADEVRELAELSTTQSRNIQKVIKETADLINTAVSSSTETQNRISKIFSTVNSIDSLMAQINALTQAQTAESNTIINDLEDMRTVAFAVKDSSDALSNESESILRNSDQMALISEGMDQAFNKVFVQIQEINQVIEAIKYLDQKNRRGIGALLLAGGRFKVDSATALPENLPPANEQLSDEAKAFIEKEEEKANIEEDDDIILF